MSKSHWLDRSLFTSPYYYRLCLTEVDYHKELKRLKLPKEKWPSFLNNDHCGGTLHEFISSNGTLCAIICIEVKEEHNIAQIHALLVHEAMHLWRWIREHLGENDPSIELEAYAVQSLSQRLFESYKAQSKKAKK
jgi:hypothetical protein